jgi:integrase
VRRGKGGKSRVVAFDAETSIAIRRYVRARDERFPGLLDESAPLFVSRTGVPLSYSGLGQMMARLGRDCGVHVRAHLFRHTWADAARRSGMNDSDIMELAGWTTGAMLRKYAAATAQERALEAARAHPVKVF